MPSTRILAPQGVDRIHTQPVSRFAEAEAGAGVEVGAGAGICCVSSEYPMSSITFTPPGTLCNSVSSLLCSWGVSCPERVSEFPVAVSFTLSAIAMPASWDPKVDFNMLAAGVVNGDAAFGVATG